MELIRKIYSTLAGHRRDVEVTKGTQYKLKKPTQTYIDPGSEKQMQSPNKFKPTLSVVTCANWYLCAVMCFPNNVFASLRVDRGGGWKLVFAWFSSFPVAFKWARWIRPSTRTACPQSLMVLVLSVTHPGSDLTASSFVPFLTLSRVSE